MQEQKAAQAATAMKYTFRCTDDTCGSSEIVEAPGASGPPDSRPCTECGAPAEHDFLADIRTISLDTSACRDHDDVAPQHRLAPTDGLNISPAKREALYQRDIQETRARLRDGNRGSFKQTHKIPAELFHGKIRETGDRHYWQDKKNLKRHKSTEVAT